MGMGNNGLICGGSLYMGVLQAKEYGTQYYLTMKKSTDAGIKHNT